MRSGRSWVRRLRRMDRARPSLRIRCVIAFACCTRQDADGAQRAAPTPPASAKTTPPLRGDANWSRPSPPALDRSASQRTPPRTPSPYKANLSRSESQRVASNTTASDYQPARPAPPRPPVQVPEKGDTLSPVPAPVRYAEGTMHRPRPREKPRPVISDEEVVRRLEAICTDADPTKLYRSLVKIGQGCVLVLARQILQIRGY